MTPFICATCGVQYAASADPPAHCLICEDDRQYIGWNGQRWTTLDEVRAGHRALITEEEPGLTGIGCEPSFAIGQRALLVQTPAGNVLWDCVPLLNDEIGEAVRARGGIAAIALSHPHMAAAMVEWSQAFDAPIYLHAADREWVMRPDPAIVFWEEKTREIVPGVTLVHLGGHFPGSAVLHWADGQAGRGVLLTGDTIYVVSDRRWVTFMYSYPNLIPLPAREVERIGREIAPYPAERLYSAFAGRVVASDAAGAIQRSVARYLRALGGETEAR